MGPHRIPACTVQSVDRVKARTTWDARLYGLCKVQGGQVKARSKKKVRQYSLYNAQCSYVKARTIQDACLYCATNPNQGLRLPCFVICGVSFSSSSRKATSSPKHPLASSFPPPWVAALLLAPSALRHWQSGQRKESEGRGIEAART